MSRRDPLAETLAHLSAARANPHAPGAAETLRRALADRSNLVVARAAEIVAEWELAEAAPDLMAAFDRFMIDPARRDPTCAAKIALAEALLRLDAGDAEHFRRGLVHIQPEPVWGGTQDTAAPLRAICAVGLARANPPDVLLDLAGLLADPEADARAGAARAIAAAGRPGGAALLWFKVRAGDVEVGPLAECFAGLLALEPERAVAFVGGYLEADSAALAEAAALALGRSGLAAAAPLLRDAWQTAGDPGRRQPFLRALALLGDEAAFAFLLELVASGPAGDARDALAALAVIDDRRLRRKIDRAAAGLGARD